MSVPVSPGMDAPGPSSSAASACSISARLAPSLAAAAASTILPSLSNLNLRSTAIAPGSATAISPMVWSFQWRLDSGHHSSSLPLAQRPLRRVRSRPAAVC